MQSPAGDTGQLPVIPTSTTTTPPAGSGTWHLAPDPRLWADGPQTVWTGDGWIVFAAPAGRSAELVAMAYDPASDRWRDLPPIPGGFRSRPGVIWTGSEVLVVGGTHSASDQPASADLSAILAYDPKGDQWRTLLARLPGQVGSDPRLALLGDELFVWKGFDAVDPKAAEAVLIDLAAGATRPVPKSPLAQRFGASVTAADREVLVWGGWDGESATLADGAAFDPAAGSWRPIPAAPLDSRTDPASVWTGSELVIWGGEHRQPMASGRGAAAGQRQGASTVAPQRFEHRLLADGAAYNPDSRQWRTLAASPLSSRAFLSPVQAPYTWTGRQVVILGGSTGCYPACAAQDGAAYDPAADRWERLAPFPPSRYPPSQNIFQVAWTGQRVIAAAGFGLRVATLEWER